MPVHAPIAGKARGHALRARAVSAAVEEGEIGRHQVGPVRHPHRELRREVVLAVRYRRQQVRPRRRAVDAVRLLRRVRDEGLVEGGEGAEELAREAREVVDDELQGAGRGPLQLVGGDAGDAGAAAALVGYPVEGVARRVLAVAPQVALVVEGAPAAVGVLRAEALEAGRVDRALLHLHLRHLLLGHDVEVEQGGVEEEVRVDGRVLVDGEVAVLKGDGWALDHHLQRDKQDSISKTS